MTAKRDSETSRKKWRRSGILFATLIAAISYLVYKPDSPSNSQPIHSKSPVPGAQTGWTPRLSGGDASLRHNPLDEPPQSDETATIDDDTLFSFASEDDLLAFLAAAENAGLHGIEASNRLLTARYKTNNPSDAHTAQSLARQWTSPEKNHTILIPFPVGISEPYQGLPFEDGTLDYIGVPPNNHTLGKGVKIAILDTGVLEHASLKGVSIEHIDLIEGDDSPFSSHGTAVASLVAGQMGIGISPSSELLSIRVLDSDGIGNSFTLAKGIVEAVDRGADIINMSLGGFGHSAVLENAVNYARENGVALVAASGNEGLEILPYPAQYEGVIAVSSIDADSTHARFSNQGDAVAIAAPGVGIHAAWENEKVVLFTGTSASTPLVASSIAAIMSESQTRDAHNAAARLIETANDIGYPGEDQQTGSGILNLKRALYNNDQGVTDLALADIFMSPKLNDAGEIVVYLSVQNRGTETINRPIIKISEDGGFPRTVVLNSLKPGEVDSHQVSVYPSPNIPDKGYTIEATAEIGANIEDSESSNDSKSADLRTAPTFSSPDKEP